MKTELDSYLGAYGSFNDWLIQKRYSYLEKYFYGKTCLELGIAEGTGVDRLIDFFEELTIVDGSRQAIANIIDKYPNSKLDAICEYFESMELGQKKFDTIIMAHILEHVEDPKTVIKKAKNYLSPNGVMIIDVPNGNSLHRQLGVKLGMLRTKTELNVSDISIGHRRVYTPDSFRKDITESGMQIVQYGGVFVKILSNQQTERLFELNLIEALFDLGVDNPDIAAEIYIVAKANT